jgi:N-acetylglutamate synthase-like GNAT family acetyltransferase
MRTKYSIRNATREDITVLAETIRKSFRDVADRFGLTPENCPKHPSNCTIEWIEDDIRRGVAYFILGDGDSVAGCVALERPDSGVCYLERLAVLPQKRRQGFGSALVKHILAEAASSGIACVSIGIIAAHTELKNWYLRLGFIEGETREFDHLPFSVMFMSYEIAEGYHPVDTEHSQPVSS